MPWPNLFRRRKPEKERPSPAASEPPRSRAWTSLPPLHLGVADAPRGLTGSRSFLAGLGTRRPPFRSVRPLVHDVTPEASHGLVTGLVAPRVETASHAELPLAGQAAVGVEEPPVLPTVERAAELSRPSGSSTTVPPQPPPLPSEARRVRRRSVEDPPEPVRPLTRRPVPARDEPPLPARPAPELPAPAVRRRAADRRPPQVSRQAATPHEPGREAPPRTTPVPPPPIAPVTPITPPQPDPSRPSAASEAEIVRRAPAPLPRRPVLGEPLRSVPRDEAPSEQPQPPTTPNVRSDTANSGGLGPHIRQAPAPPARSPDAEPAPQPTPASEPMPTLAPTPVEDLPVVPARPAQPAPEAVERAPAAPPRPTVGRRAPMTPLRPTPSARPGPSGSGGPPPVRARHVQRAPASVPPEARSVVEQTTGADLADVEVRRGPGVSATASALAARAYTAEGRIHLPEEHGPLTSGPTKALVAHELTHVAQQRVLGPALPPEDSAEGTRLEEAAVRNEHAVAEGRPPAPDPASTAPASAAPRASPAPPSMAAPTSAPVGAAAPTSLPVAPASPGASSGRTGRDPAAAAVAAGVAARAPDGSVVFSAPPRVSPPPSSPTSRATSPVQRAPQQGVQRAVDVGEMATAPAAAAPAADAAATSLAGAATGGGAGAEEAADADGEDSQDLDDLARRLWPRIQARLRGDLVIARERTGTFVDRF